MSEEFDRGVTYGALLYGYALISDFIALVLVGEEGEPEELDEQRVERLNLLERADYHEVLVAKMLGRDTGELRGLVAGLGLQPVLMTPALFQNFAPESDEDHAQG